MKKIAEKYNLSKYEVIGDTLNINTQDFKEQEKNINILLKENKKLYMKLFNQIYHKNPYYMIYKK